MCNAALTLGRTIGYTNAGAVEFLLASFGEFYFIEVNTYAQAEHRVTELVTGVSTWFEFRSKLPRAVLVRADSLIEADKKSVSTTIRSGEDHRPRTRP